MVNAPCCEMIVRIGKKRVDNILTAYLAVIYTLIMSGSVFQYAYMGTLGTVNIFVTAFLFCAYILRHGTGITRLKKNIADIFVILSGVGLLACMAVWLDFSAFLGYVSKFCVVLMPWLICKYIKMEDFMETYIKVIFFIAVVSLVLFLFPAVLSLFPIKTVIETSQWSFDYYLIYAAYHNPIYKTYLRNIGIFWEPGMYQGYLIFAMMYVAAAKKRNIRNLLYQLVMVATLFTAQSSTGFILLLPVLMIYVLTGIPAKRKVLRVLLTMAAVAAVGVLLLEPQIFFSILDAISPSISAKLRAGNTGGSMGTRVYGMLADAYLAIRNPFGIGETQLSAYRSSVMGMLGFLTDGANINTTFTMMLYYGWIPGILYLVMMVKGCFRFFGKNLIGMVALIIMLVIINTEPHYMTLFFTIIFMYFVQFGEKNIREPVLKQSN